MRQYLRINEAAQQLGVTTQSVRRYVNDGKLKSDHTPSGQRIFKQEYINEFMGLQEQGHEETIAYYVRSSNGDKTLLNTQLEQLTQAYGEASHIYKDTSSGLNANRKGLNRLLDDAQEGKINHVIITQKDRLSRFGFEYLERLLKDYGTKLTIINDTPEKSLQEELMQDFMSLIASFSGKFYRLRGNEHKSKLLDEAKRRLS